MDDRDNRADANPADADERPAPTSAGKFTWGEGDDPARERCHSLAPSKLRTE